MTTGNGETGEGESSFVELMDLVSRQQREEVLEQILQLLLQCSRDGAFVCFLINSLQTSRSSRDGSAEKVVTALRRLLRLVGSKPVLSVTATEILINFTADEQLANLMLGEFKDMATLLLENLKRQQQQQQRGGLGEGDDGVPMHLSVSLMLLSNVTRHRQAIQILFNPELPLPDFHLLPFVLLLHEAPRDPGAPFWKEQGVFLLHVLQNATSSDAAVDFLLRRRMATVNNVLSLLPHMPPLCQKPLLTLALRLCSREQLHPFLLPAEHGALRRRLESHLQESAAPQPPKEASEKDGEKSQSAEAPEDCRLLHVLCCFLYPAKGSALRDKAVHELQQQEAQEASSRSPQSDTQGSKEVTEKQRLRFLNPSVDEQSYGPSEDPTARKIAVDCIAALATSPHARWEGSYVWRQAVRRQPDLESLLNNEAVLEYFRRETLRWFGVYEVLRAVFCIEPEEIIRDKVEDMVHVLVFSEEELREQDQQQQGSTPAAKSLALKNDASAVPCQP